MPSHWLTIGEVADRTGIARSALRFYESEGLIEAQRTDGGQRRYARDVLRRVAFIGAAQTIGLPLDEVRATLESLPRGRTPTKADWSRLSRAWRPLLDERIATFERLRDELDSCIGCGLGSGPRFLLGDTSADLPNA
jgi:MerR family redox-sensitive transcriptional activator SoxR